MCSPRPTSARLAVLAAVTLGVAATGCSRVTSHSLNSEGVRLYQTGNYQQAAAQFQKAIASNPESADGYYNLASALHQSGKMQNRPEDLRQAEQLYNQALNHSPDHAECYRGLAVLLVDTNRRDAAFRLLEGWAGRSPQLADPRIELARLLEETGSTQQATTRLVEALVIEPQNARALTALGRLREQSGDLTQALANYERSLAVNRFQPEVAARVAMLKSNGTPSSIPAGTPSQPATRTVQQRPSTVRY